MNNEIDEKEIARLQELDRRTKERYRKQNKHTNTLYDRISFTVPKGQKECIEKLAKGRGMSVNAFISGLVMDELDCSEGENRTAVEENTNFTKETEEIVNINNEAQKQKEEDNRKKILQQIKDIEFGINQRKTKKLSE